MPLYDYTCRNCQRTFELLVRASTVPRCRACGSSDLQQLVSAPVAPGRSAAIMAAARARAEKEGHTCNHTRVNGRIVD